MIAIGRALALALVHGYRLLLSPVLPATCRYLPTCSEYGLEAISRWGVAAGGWLTLKRLARCHPWGGGGFDPVPNPFLQGTRDAPSGHLCRRGSAKRHDDEGEIK